MWKQMKESTRSVHYLHLTLTYSSGHAFRQSAIKLCMKCTITYSCFLKIVHYFHLCDKWVQYKLLNKDCYDFIVQNVFQKFHRWIDVPELPVTCKGKAVPLQVWSGPEGSRKLRFPDYMTMAQDGGKVVSLTHRPPLPPGNAPGTYFC